MIYNLFGFAEVQILKMFENLGFLKFKFSIFTIGEYRKDGFIKVGEKKSAISETSAFSTWPMQQ